MRNEEKKMIKLLSMAMAITAVSYGVQAESKDNADIEINHIIYGKDNRSEIINSNKTIQKLGKSVAARIPQWQYSVDEISPLMSILKFRKSRVISFDYALTLSDPYGANICKDEKFSDQPTISDCSGFLIDDQYLATAGHCVIDGGELKKGNSYHCEDNTWLFDYNTKSNGNTNLDSVPVKNNYRCVQVVYAILEDDKDFAIIKLDRKVEGRDPLQFRTSGKIADQAEVFVIGHPSGLPKKYSGEAVVKENTSQDYFSTNLDTFGGNSGSPVFNAKTNEVEGILVRGKVDYVYDSEAECNRPNKCSSNRDNCVEVDDSIDGEQASRVIDLMPFLK